MSIEQRQNLLGAWAIHCDTPDCHIEIVSIDEDEVRGMAKADGWDLTGSSHVCGDCASGTSPQEVINESLPAAAAAPEPMIPSTPDHVGDLDEGYEDDDVDDEGEYRPPLADAPDPEVIAARARRKAERDKPTKPYNFADAGDTVPDVTAKAEDMETAEDVEKRERREKRARQRREEAKKQSKEKTLAAMSGVDDLLDDFNDMFGSSKTTWDD